MFHPIPESRFPNESSDSSTSIPLTRQTRRSRRFSGSMRRSSVLEAQDANANEGGIVPKPLRSPRLGLRLLIPHDRPRLPSPAHISSSRRSSRRLSSDRPGSAVSNIDPPATAPPSRSRDPNVTVPERTSSLHRTGSRTEDQVDEVTTEDQSRPGTELGVRRRRRKPGISLRRRSCLPREPTARNKAVSCILFGGCLTVLLTIYLALALAPSSQTAEYQILLLLMVLIITILFCNSLIRLCMILWKATRDGEDPLIPTDWDGGYARLDRPIHVHLARDEEIILGEKPVEVREPPPAYGLWRSSVRVDPNLLYWKRVSRRISHALGQIREEAEPSNSPSPSSAGPASPSARRASNASARPPSYMSEDGVEYVLEAAPRSIAPRNSMEFRQTRSLDANGSALGRRSSRRGSMTILPRVREV